MSQQIAEANVRSEDHDGIDDDKMVPVSESVRYRKRAQKAEQKVKDLSQQLDESRSQTKSLSERMSKLEGEQNLTRKLIAAGAVDVETALLVAEERLSRSEDADADTIVEQLRMEKGYLFNPGKTSDKSAGLTRTTPVKERRSSAQSTLDKAAKRAASSGSRTDLQQYLRLRRNFR